MEFIDELPAVARDREDTPNWDLLLDDLNSRPGRWAQIGVKSYDYGGAPSSWRKALDRRGCEVTSRADRKEGVTRFYARSTEASLKIKPKLTARSKGYRVGIVWLDEGKEPASMRKPMGNKFGLDLKEIAVILQGRPGEWAKVMSFPEEDKGQKNSHHLRELLYRRGLEARSRKDPELMTYTVYARWVDGS